MHAAPALLETQRRFLAALYDDAETGPLTSITGNGLDPAARLRIYRHSCDQIQNLALRTTYPAILALVGDEFFDQTAHGYRAAFPSHCGNLQAFGQHLAEYLDGLPAVHALAYLPDVARLEWLRQESALSADCATWPRPSVQRSRLHPSVRLLASPYPVLTIWRYSVQPTSERLLLPDGGERIVLWREDDQVAMAELDSASFACIESLSRGSVLANAYQAGYTQDPEFDFAACTESLIDRGLLRACISSEDSEET